MKYSSHQFYSYPRVSLSVLYATVCPVSVRHDLTTVTRSGELYKSESFSLVSLVLGLNISLRINFSIISGKKF